jgi:hypothetical protein
MPVETETAASNPLFLQLACLYLYLSSHLSCFALVLLYTSLFARESVLLYTVVLIQITCNPPVASHYTRPGEG